MICVYYRDDFVFIVKKLPWNFEDNELTLLLNVKFDVDDNDYEKKKLEKLDINGSIIFTIKT